MGLAATKRENLCTICQYPGPFEKCFQAERIFAVGYALLQFIDSDSEITPRLDQRTRLDEKTVFLSLDY